jgi:hypothetical protein
LLYRNKGTECNLKKNQILIVVLISDVGTNEEKRTVELSRTLSIYGNGKAGPSFSAEEYYYFVPVKHIPMPKMSVKIDYVDVCQRH